MYQPYPSGGQIPPEPSPATPPRPVRAAAQLMYAGAAVSVITLIVTILARHTIEREIERGSNFTSVQAHQLVISVIVQSVITTGLWLFMAWANKAGHGWARITATVLFGLNTLGLLLNVVRASVSLSLAFVVLMWLIGLGAIVLLWRKESSEYFAARRAAR